MIILRSKFYSNKEEDKKSEKKLDKVLDKVSLWEYNHLHGPKLNEIERARVNQVLGDEDDEKVKEGNKKIRNLVLKTSATLPIVGAGLGAGINAIRKKDIKEGALNGAKSGALVGLGFIAKGKIGRILRKKLANSNKKYKDSWKKQSDLLDVSERKMSEEEFVDKWGKKKED